MSLFIIIIEILLFIVDKFQNEICSCFVEVQNKLDIDTIKFKNLVRPNFTLKFNCISLTHKQK